MSSTKFSVVTSFPRTYNHFPPSNQQLASSSLVACTHWRARSWSVWCPYLGKSLAFKSRTALDGGDSDTTNMLYMKPISPSVPPSQDYYTSYLTSACSSPDTSSMEAACPPTTRDFDHMYAR